MTATGSAGAGAAAGAAAGASEWRGRRVLVAGLRITGRAVAGFLLDRGAQVVVIDHSEAAAVRMDAERLAARGARVVLGPAAETDLAGHLAHVELVVASPGFAPSSPLVRCAQAAGVPVWTEVELAARVGSVATRWYAVTGTNGKTTVTEMLAGMLQEGGLRSAAAGNIGPTLLEAVLHEPPYEALAVELSSFQLHGSVSVRPAAAAVLNVVPDHLDWHGSPAAYAAAKARIFASGTIAVAVRDDPGAAAILAAAPGRRVAVTAGEPAPGELGVRAGWLEDRAFGAGRICPVTQLSAPGRHNVTNGLAAAALALAAGVPPAAVAEVLGRFHLGAHRCQTIAVHAGVTYVDDSKATNPHAALAGISGFSSVVWIAGGLNKGLAFDELVADAAPRLRAAVLLGACAEEIAGALARRAPQVPVVRAASMDHAVMHAVELAVPGDTVLLAPAAASFDMFTDYADRGRRFADAVRSRAAAGPAAPESVRRPDDGRASHDGRER